MQLEVLVLYILMGFICIWMVVRDSLSLRASKQMRAEMDTLDEELDRLKGHISRLRRIVANKRKGEKK